jgi:hypothetical protein
VVAQPLLGPIALGGVIAAITVALQVWLKLLSRQPPDDDAKHGLVREDLVWWRDWVVAAVVSVALLAFSTAHARDSLTSPQVATLIFVFIMGASGLPGMIRTWGYTTATPPALRRWMGIFVPNVAGALILLAAIASGAKLAG